LILDFAVIDLGTNTFHLAIVKNGQIVFKTSKAAKLGMGGMSNKTLTPDAMQRGLLVLEEFSSNIKEYEIAPDLVYAYGTSALRNANNAADFVNLIAEKTGIEIRIIDGQQEAELIYNGVKNAVNITEPSMIVDIGGGSVEFIICNADKKLWQQSFEIGGLRLMEKYMDSDPINPALIPKMNDFFTEKLLDLHNAVHQYRPFCLVGSSGSFDTLNDMFHYKTTGKAPDKNQAGFDYSISSFYKAFEQLVFQNKEERLKIPGMIPLRVEMIVVAMILIAYLIRTFDLKTIKISNYALLEGAVYKHIKE
jgi:exopolyphosphatase / guanosine-5'-triphosphate,3'-diphosphate pyrophosphatase